MKSLAFTFVLVFSFTHSFSQQTKIPPKNYPSLLWEISGRGMVKPSYLFGTMHVSSKMVFHLSDSFYLGIKNADVVALETDMGSWQDDFSRYDLEGSGFNFDYNLRRGADGPGDYLTIGTLQFPPYEKLIEMALYSSPAMINSFLYRTNSDKALDFEEDTYLDMHIYQAGKKWGKKVCGVENFDRSMELMKEAYRDAAKEKNRKGRDFDIDAGLSYSKLEDAYRTGNLDLLDTINKVNSTSAAFDEKFLYRRNEIQAGSIDSILKTGHSLFVGVGAAHLPGQRGVIELLRARGYRLRPIKMAERDSRHKNELEKIRVPVRFSRQYARDGLFSVNMPGKLYNFNTAYGIVDQQQFADMSNGAYYMVTRINTNSILWGDSEETVLRRIDSVIYENVPGKILVKRPIIRNGYRGFEVRNRTRRGDFQRYNIFVTPFEIIVFKMSGNGDYVREGTEADQFFGSIQFAGYQDGWKKWTPSFGGFEVSFPHEPLVIRKANWQFMALDRATNTGFEVIRTDIHNYGFVEEDSFDLDLMEESFASSDFIDRAVSRRFNRYQGYPALDVQYRYRDGSVALVRFLIQGTHYYTLVTHSQKENGKMAGFLNSFTLTPFRYGAPELRTDTTLYFTVASPVPLDKPKKRSMYPTGLASYNNGDDEDADLAEENIYRTKTIMADSSGEKISVQFSKPARYYYNPDTTARLDSSSFDGGRMHWQFRSRKEYRSPLGFHVYDYVLGDPGSSRCVRGRLMVRKGVSYWLQAEGDTLSSETAFVSRFFDSFTPADTVQGSDPHHKKTKLFFQDFFSADSLLHKKAVANVSRLEVDSSDFADWRQCIRSLTWKEKKYMSVRNDFIAKLGDMTSPASSDYLKELYYAAGDTVDFQYTVLSTLLHQKTAHAYQVFRDIMVNDPPVLDVDNGNTPAYGSAGSGNYFVRDQDDGDFRNQNFLDQLSDSLQLTATIFRDLLPLVNLHDYEQTIMELAGLLMDSSLIRAKDYEAYQTKFLVEAKQLLKKQLIMEKNKAIEEARRDGEEENSVYGNAVSEDDEGNAALSLYATLLLPIMDQTPAVQQYFSQLLRSDDRRLKYATALLLLRNQKPVPDTLLPYFAALDEYRYELYTDLKRFGRLQFFPERFGSQEQLAQSRLFDISGSYSRPDTVVYLSRLPVKLKDKSGVVLFFKYRSKKDDNNWKLATVGLLPSDPKQREWDHLKPGFRQRRDTDLTQLSDTKIEGDTPVDAQLRKALKKLLFSKHNSAAQFYKDEDRMDGSYYPAFSLGE